MHHRFAIVTLVGATLLACFVAWFVFWLFVAASSRSGAPTPTVEVAGIALELLLFGALMAGLGRGGRAESDARNLLRALVLLGALWNVAMLVGALGEIQTTAARGDLPFVVPGAPFGSDRQPTLLGLGLMAITAAGALLAAALAFRREGVAGGLFLGCGALALAQDLSRLLSGNYNLPSFWTGLAVGILPTLGVGTLLLLSRRARRKASTPRPAPGRELGWPLGARRGMG